MPTWVILPRVCWGLAPRSSPRRSRPASIPGHPTLSDFRPNPFAIRSYKTPFCNVLGMCSCKMPFSISPGMCSYTIPQGGTPHPSGSKSLPTRPTGAGTRSTRHFPRLNPESPFAPISRGVGFVAAPMKLIPTVSITSSFAVRIVVAAPGSSVAIVTYCIHCPIISSPPQSATRAIRNCRQKHDWCTLTPGQAGCAPQLRHHKKVARRREPWQETLILTTTIPK